MSEMSWEHASEARAALNAIVSDPDHGVAALSNPTTMSNLLKDYLPDAPREKSILVAAAEAGLAGTLRDHVSQGMDAGTAIRLTAASFSSSTPFTPEACNWVTDELALALGISQPGAAGYGGGGQGGANPPGFAPTAGDALPTQMAGFPGAGGPGAGGPGAGGPGAGGPGAGGPGAGGPGYQAPGYQAPGFGQPAAQPDPREQPTAMGYRPGYGPQPQQGGFQGGGYGGGAGAPAQGYQPQQGFPTAPNAGQGYQGQPGFGTAPTPVAGFGQQGPGYPGQQGFGPPGQGPAAPGWNQPGGGFGGPAGYGGTPVKPGGSRRGLFIGGGIAAVIVIVIIAVVALSGGKKTPGPSPTGSSTPTTQVTNTPTTSPTTSPPPSTGVESLTTIMNPAGETPIGRKCVKAVLFGLNAASISSRIFCPDTTAKNIQVWGYQFFTAAGYQAGLAHINSYTGFKSTSDSCPPAAGKSSGTGTWHANHNPKYGNHPGQILECFTDGQQPVLIWTMPTMNVFFIAEDRVKGTTIQTVQNWWDTLLYG